MVDGVDIVHAILNDAPNLLVDVVLVDGVVGDGVGGWRYCCCWLQNTPVTSPEQ